ncbi:hypothetical protein LVU62_06430 [Klebsiella variicola subsp. variicola]|uniref:DUF6731 family protein n=1 Tax=Klebsiella pneumoniae complex TaxID=3390273 RepID=UPI001E49726A|nr:DUF6731 family protein [Klebsiella variicola]MCE0292441.1 hypothetical protein [Klebsiella variicola subsp. variicola]MCS6089417.1 hypothetical protein [Klebsiella pneumoniae subsp. pneumoniae]
MASKRFFFDFYQCNTISTDANAAIQSPEDVFNSLFVEYSENPTRTVRKVGSKLIEIRFLERTRYGYRGVIGKHRANDLPHVAVAGGQEREILLEENENLLEKAYFHFYSQDSVLIIQRNRFCYSWLLLSKYLSSSSQNTTVNPIIQANSLEWLLRNEVHIKTLEIGIARPRNAQIFENVEHDFNNALIATLNGTNSAKVNLTLRGDGRADAPENRYLGSRLKRALTETLETFEVEKLKLETQDIETGIQHPIDLVADKLVYYTDVELGGRYPLAASIWDALTQAKDSKNDELAAYFGVGGQRVE